MALTFPSSPTNGQIYVDSLTGYRYIYNSNTSAWGFSSNNVGMSVSSTPPSNVGSGSMWYNREIGRTFVYYNDGDSSQWVETVPAGSIDTTTIASYVNPIYASLNTNWSFTNTAYTFANIAVNTANTAFPNTSNVSFNGSFNLPLGTIGIGTNAYPVGKFHVTGANGEITRTTATGASGGYHVSFFDNSTPWYFGSAKATINGNINDLYFGSGPGTTNNLIFGTAGTERLRVDGTGISTTSIKTANVVNSTGSVVFVNGYPRQPGQIIEYLSNPCDGSTIVGASGSYIVQNVTTSQAATDTFTDITGSTISYVPPSGARKVIYRFDYSLTYSSVASPIIHIRFLIDSTEVAYARRDNAWQSSYPQTRLSFEWPISIGGSDATSTTGRIATWTTAKTLKLQVRRYSSSYAGTLHSLVDWDGSNQTGMLLMPTISIIAIA